MLSTELSINIQRALCLGRDHRLRLVEVKAAKRKLDLEKVDTLALIETREFCAGLKRRAIEHQGEPTEQQAEDLKELTSSISRGRIDVDTIEKEYEQLDIDVENGLKKWKNAWLAVDKTMDPVWEEAKLLRAHHSTNREDGVRGSRSPTAQAETIEEADPGLDVGPTPATQKTDATSSKPQPSGPRTSRVREQALARL
jgi:hypothetical protein